MEIKIPSTITARYDDGGSWDEECIGMLIRCNHPWAFRRGQWGTIIDVRIVDINDDERSCYHVEWQTDAWDSRLSEDLWPVEDPAAEYEFAVVQ